MSHDLFTALGAVPDPSKARGCRHRLVMAEPVNLDEARVRGYY
jgi:hypothetical protein